MFPLAKPFWVHLSTSHGSMWVPGVRLTHGATCPLRLLRVGRGNRGGQLLPGAAAGAALHGGALRERHRGHGAQAGRESGGGCLNWGSNSSSQYIHLY